MTKDEVLKLALEALKYPLNQSHENFNVDMAELLAHRAITAIKKALAQPEQEPVACECDSPAWCKQYKRCNRAMLGLMPYVAQRTWVEIDGDDWIKALELADFDKVAAFEFFEAKLKELNT